MALHRVRQGLVKARAAQANQIRGLLSEFGLIIPEGIAHISKRVPEMLDNAGEEVPDVFREIMQRLLAHLKNLDQQVGELERQIRPWHRSNAFSCKLEKVPGIGPITATALVASIGDAKQFANGRQLTAWLGLFPRHHSTGGKSNLLGISKSL